MHLLRHKKWAQCNKSKKLASIRINSYLEKFKQKIPLKPSVHVKILAVIILHYYNNGKLVNKKEDI